MTSNVRSSAHVKDMLIECISKDVKELQHSHSDVDTANNLVANSDEAAKQLCEHLDHVLLHGLKDIEKGYWLFVRYFTRTDAVKTINKLTQVTTDLGKGRAWLYLSLNEQATESYLRMFAEYQDRVAQFYNQDAFLGDSERLLLLQTLITGLDFICFDFTIDTPYLDYSASEPSLDTGIQDSLSYTLAVEPQFIAKVDQQKCKQLATGGGLYSQYTTGDKHETYHLNQPTTGTMPLSQSAKLNSTSETPSSNYPLLLGRQNSEKKTSTTVSTASRSSSSKEYKRYFPENIGASSVSVRGPDAVYNMSSSLSTQGDGEIEVTSVRKSKGKKKKGKKKKKTSTEPDTVTKQVVEERTEVQNQDDIIAASHGRNTDSPDLGGTQLASSSLDLENNQKSSAMFPISPGANEKHGTPMILGDSTDNSLHTQPQSSDQRTSKISTHTSPRRVSPEVLPITEHSRNNVTPTQDATQNGHLDSTNVSKPSHKIPAEIDSSQVSRNEDSSGRLSSVHNKHTQHLEELTVVNNSHDKKFQDQFTDKNLVAMESHNQYSDKSSPQEESWVKQLFVAREKAIAQGEGQQRRQQNSEEFDKKHFASNTAKFTTMVEDSSAGGTGKTGSSRHEGPKAVLLPVEGPTVADVKELLCSRDVTKAEMIAVEMNVDQNTRLIFSLEIFLDPNEEMIKLIQVSSPDERGNRQMAFVLVSNQTVYLLRKDGADHDGLDYSREVGIPLDQLKHLIIGLNWQSVVITYNSSSVVVVLTGNEAVTRTVVEAINKAVLSYNQYHLPMNKGDDWRTKALSKEIDKIDQNAYMILLYSLVNWEQLKGDLPAILISNEQDGKSGVLYYKAVMLGMTYWKQGHFVIRKGNLYLYSSENDKTPKAQYSLCNKNCGGCKRVPGERVHSFMVVFNGSADLVLSANSEEEMLDWMQALCEAVVGKKSAPKNTMSACISCGVLITSNKVCIIKEEWIGGVVKETMMTSCNIDDITTVEVDPLLPLYCIISYDPSERSDAESISWLICFESTHELSKFSIKLAEEWKKTFQIDIDFTEVKDDAIKQRAYKAVDLMQASRYRSDSITRGRGVPLMI